MSRTSTLLLIAIAALPLGFSNGVAAQSPANSPSPAELVVQQKIVLQARMIDHLRDELDHIQKKRVIANEKLNEIEATENQSGVSVESFPEIVKNLQAKRIDLMIDLAGLDAKRLAIQKAEMQRSDNSAIIRPLEKLVRLKEARLEKIRNAPTSEDEQRSAQMDLLSSQVQLASAKSNRTSSNLLSDSLLSTSLDLAEAKARLSKTESLLSDVLPSRKQLEIGKLIKSNLRQYMENETTISNDLRTEEQVLKKLRTELEQLKKSQHLP
jgi:hypothetical protein